MKVVAFAIGLQLVVVGAGALVPTARAQTTESQQAQALKLITDTANQICAGVPIEGSQSTVELSGSGKAALNGVIAKIADLGIQGAGKFENNHYKGVLQSELAEAIKNGNDCRLSVFNTLVKRLLPYDTGEPQPPTTNATWSSLPPVTMLPAARLCSCLRFEADAKGNWRAVPAGVTMLRPAANVRVTNSCGSDMQIVGVKDTNPASVHAPPLYPAPGRVYTLMTLANEHPVIFDMSEAAFGVLIAIDCPPPNVEPSLGFFISAR